MESAAAVLSTDCRAIGNGKFQAAETTLTRCSPLSNVSANVYTDGENSRTYSG